MAGCAGRPRDALIADLTPKEIQGAAFGLRQSLDTVGAVAGPLIAMLLMLAWNDDFRAVFWVAVIPAILSFLLVAFAVRDPEAPKGEAKAAEKVKLNRATLAGLGPAFWAVTAAGTALTAGITDPAAKTPPSKKRGRPCPPSWRHSWAPARRPGRSWPRSSRTPRPASPASAPRTRTGCSRARPRSCPG